MRRLDDRHDADVSQRDDDFVHVVLFAPERRRGNFFVPVRQVPARVRVNV